ncbi:RNA polymerase-associated protein CTR9-like protein [Pyrus ussuriensis x Pyrus communis]|uniref:RNA polymerase-associated protein CTR9-like protein n=1 Tax=Pyrus ussuriensis x Pyrus communis TaxID=2448454 RepID=A0A5N5GUK1_9ROSA|nr:RNA polymerase-associated protein CTR9-like protein [Pyrus ussuriensis x Pyrus communis]
MQGGARNSEEEVRVVLDQLPKEANDIIDILKAEQASLDLWLIIAACVEFNRGHYSDSLELYKGDYEKAGVYYMASVKEISKPHEFVFPYYGLGQVQLKMGYLRSSLSNFEKVLEVYPDNSDTLKLGQTEKALEFMRKATKVDPDDSQALLDLGSC